VIGARLFPTQHYGFLSYDTPQAAAQAIQVMNNSSMFSQSSLDVSFKVDRQQQGYAQGARKFRPY
jgi:hypothetical protein